MLCLKQIKKLGKGWIMAEQKLKKLPLSITTFSEIIQENYIYVDKTEYIYNMVTGSKYYFLSRPRRFGKSLLVSTLAELFSGNKELFKNLWIDKSDYDWQKYPVIRFDFSSIGHRMTADLITNIDVRLDTIARDYKLDVSGYPSIDSKFQEIIIQLSKINKVAILIDEYDKPILDHIDNIEEAKAQCEVLKSLYSVIKGSDQYIRFVLLTGVSKFAQTSIFSGLNNLNDICMDRRYAAMLGYTHKELVQYFTPYIERLAQAYQKTIAEIIEDITNHYDGYQFAEDSERMFNPFSVMRCFDKQKLGNYWFASGTPTFLINLIKKGDYDVDSVTHPVLNADDLGSFESDNIPLPSLLFQTGYLTIESYDVQTDNYTLAVPNQEVYRGFTRQLANVFTSLPVDKSIQYARRIFKEFLSVDMPKLKQVLQEFFNKMPYTVHIKSESQLQFVLYAIFALIGVTVDPEVTTSLGRADLVVSLPQPSHEALAGTAKLVYVIELKFNGSAQKALEQIRDKKYYEKYENTDKQIILVGINFESETKTVSLESQMSG